MIPCGYSCLLLLFLLYGLMVGTWSFQMGGEAPPFAARLLRMLHISEASGMVEMSAFCCIASERRTSPSSRPWGAGPPPDGCGISACPVRMGWSLLWASCSCSPPP